MPPDSDFRRSPAPPRRSGAFWPISGPRAADEIVDQLVFAIRSGQYDVGDRLPSIPELAEMTQVSRPTVGEAIRQLADLGVLDVRRGSMGGSTVRSITIPARSLPHQGGRRDGTMRELVEARRPVEIELTRLATIRATDDDFDALQQANDLLLQVRSAGSAEWAHASNRFHYAIGYAARSDVLAYVQHQILQQITVLLDSYSVAYSDPDLTIREHIDTLAAMRTRDPEIAVASMSAQLEELENVAQWYDDARAEQRGDEATPESRPPGANGSSDA